MELAASWPVASGLLLQAATGGGYAGEILRAVLALAGVCLLAWVSLRLLASRGVPWLGRGGAGQGELEILERVTLEPRRSLYLVRAGARRLLIGVGEGGPPRLLLELDAPDSGPRGDRPVEPSAGGGDDG